MFSKCSDRCYTNIAEEILQFLIRFCVLSSYMLYLSPRRARIITFTNPYISNDFTYSDDALQQYLIHQNKYNPRLFGPNASEEILTSNSMFISNPAENLPLILQRGIDVWLDVRLLISSAISCRFCRRMLFVEGIFLILFVSFSCFISVLCVGLFFISIHRVMRTMRLMTPMNLSPKFLWLRKLISNCRYPGHEIVLRFGGLSMCLNVRFIRFTRYVHKKTLYPFFCGK